LLLNSPALAFAVADYLLTGTLWAVPLVALLVVTLVLARRLNRSDPPDAARRARCEVS
jgi:cytochrome c-type biogenesis protein CcmH/NrfF